ncbi:MAG: SH3 domain-containing protein [Anaerovibrio sp.]|uniref:SH3 domain-containing protein n=1 Tax=Anaerovibrio sp. TaxID=1872532 RepID=UPI0025EF1AD3|nr:SH3 domain-containing protein [Anaerovibrio sp.]MCR5175748.1 SH3 domain-containing protein [Anaerovibrio sp.]
MSKFCKNCGTQLNDNVAFCPKCGQACQPTAPQRSSTMPPDNKMNKAAPFKPQGQYIPMGNNSGPSNSVVYAVIGVVALLAIVVGAFFVVFDGDINEVKETFSIGTTEKKPAAEAPKPTGNTTNAAEQQKDTQKPHNHGVITGTEVRMRSDASTSANILGYFEKGEQVEILDSKPGWAKVKRTNGAIGWVSDQFCKF